MATAHSHSVEIRNPGAFEAPGAMKTLFLILTALGLATLVVGLMVDPTRTWASFVQDHFYFMSLALGGIFFAGIQWMTGAMWSAPLRRIMEAFASYLPISVVTLAALYFGIHHLYSWSHAEHVQGDLVLMHKAGYLSPVFFIGRNLLALLVFVFLTNKMIRNSLAQDNAAADYRLTARNRMIAPPFMILFALLYTMMSWDQMMSLDPHWYSTIFGVYCFAGAFYAVLALIALVTVMFYRSGRLNGLVNENHLHDLGKFMFAFTVFYAYIGFSQFMLIWYANMPEETLYYIHRLHGGWIYVSAFLIAGKFFTPFFLLLPRDSKRKPKMLAGVAIFMLIAHWIDIMWLVQPEFFTDGPVFGWVELGMLLGFIGLFGSVVLRFFGRHNIVAIGDPRLAESVLHHHQ